MAEVVSTGRPPEPFRDVRRNRHCRTAQLGREPVSFDVGKLAGDLICFYEQLHALPPRDEIAMRLVRRRFATALRIRCHSGTLLATVSDPSAPLAPLAPLAPYTTLT